MPNRGEHTLREILSQPDVWKQTLADFETQRAQFSDYWQTHCVAQPIEQIIITGCGSTYYQSLIAATLLRANLQINVQARPASEIIFYPEQVFTPNQRTLLIAISRSAKTTETVGAVRLFKKRFPDQPSIAITCYPNRELEQVVDFTLLASAAHEESIAQTRSFASMLLLIESLITSITQTTTLESLPQNVQLQFEAYHTFAQQLGEANSIERFFFLGSSYRYGIACEGMLKMKEMALAYSEAFHVLEFRHGPMSMVTPQSLVIGLITPESASHETAVLREMSERGAQVVAITPARLDLPESIHQVVFQSDLPTWANTILYLPFLQLLAYYRAMKNGQNPDVPANLSMVVTLDALPE